VNQTKNMKALFKNWRKFINADSQDEPFNLILEQEVMDFPVFDATAAAAEMASCTNPAEWCYWKNLDLSNINKSNFFEQALEHAMAIARGYGQPAGALQGVNVEIEDSIASNRFLRKIASSPEEYGEMIDTSIEQNTQAPLSAASQLKAHGSAPFSLESGQRKIILSKSAFKESYRKIFDKTKDVFTSFVFVTILMASVIVHELFHVLDPEIELTAGFESKKSAENRAFKHQGRFLDYFLGSGDIFKGSAYLKEVFQDLISDMSNYIINHDYYD